MCSPVDVPVERDRLDREIERDSTEGQGGTTYMQPSRQPPFWLVLLAAILAGIFAARLLENAAPDVILGEDVDAATADDRSDAVIVDSEIAEPVSEAEVSVELEPDVPTVEEPLAAEEAEEVEAPADQPEEPAADEWNAEAEWEGELAYRVFSGQGAFDVEEIAGY